MFKVQVAYTYCWSDDSEHDTLNDAEDRVSELLEEYSPDRVQILSPMVDRL